MLVLYFRPILIYSCQLNKDGLAFAAKSHIKLILQAINTTIRLIFMCLAMFEIFEHNDFIHLLNVNFHLLLEDVGNSALDTLPIYDISDTSNRKGLKMCIILNSLESVINACLFISSYISLFIFLRFRAFFLSHFFFFTLITLLRHQMASTAWTNGP